MRHIQQKKLKAKYTKSTFALSLLTLALNQTVYAAEQSDFDNSNKVATELEAMQIRANVDKEDVGYIATHSSTATKTDTPIMETPFSIQVVPQQVLQDQQANRLEDALTYVPGVVVFPTNQGTSDGFLIRGFGSNTTYRDGFFRPDVLGGGSTKSEMANVEKVEVLKGPGSLLFGRTEPGGVINVVTKQPQAQAKHSIQQQIGSYDFYRTLLDSTGALTDDASLLYRVNLSYENKNSFRDFQKNERFFIAPTLKYIFSPQTQATLELEYQNFRETPDAGILPLNGMPAPVPLSRAYDEKNTVVNNGTRWLAGLTWSHEFNNDWKIKNRISYERYDIKSISMFPDPLQADGTLDRYFNNGGDAPSKRFSTALDLTGKITTGSLKHTLLIGADYFRIKDDMYNANCCDAAPAFNYFNPVYSATPHIFDATANYELHVLQHWYGIYLQDQIELPNNLYALAGLRYDNATGKNDGQVTTQDSRVSPRVGLLWKAQPWLSLYGSYTENFGASNSLWNPPGNELKPQTAEQWEAGVKTELLDGKLSATVAYFDLTKQNVAVPAPTNPNLQKTIGESQSRGLEFDVTGEILPGWNVIGGYSYMPYAKVTEDTTGLTGNRLHLAPKNQLSLWSTYQFQGGDLKGLKLGAGVVSLSQREGDPSNSYRLPGYSVVNVMASYGWNVGVNKKLTAQLNIDNLFDRNYYAGSNSWVMITPGAPLSAKASVKLDF